LAQDWQISGESIVCFAGEDWWYHHPHSKNHIMRRFAQTNRVLFVNSITMGLPSASNADFFLKIRRKLRSQLRWLRKAPEGLYVLTPLALPFYQSRFARYLNWALLTTQVRLAMAICRMRNPIVWAAIPSAADIVDCLGAKLIVCQVSDKYDAGEDSAISKELIREMDGRLKRKAAMVFYSGRKLYEEAEVGHRYFLEQAVDFDHFATEAESTAPDIAHIPHPVLGYFGWMDYVMDGPLVEEVARRRPDWHWVFVGTRSNLFQVSAPNVHFLGAKPYAELPKYLRHFDVCVLPWQQGHAFTFYGSAIKVREYLASGKPVVISPVYEYLKTPGIRVYGSPDEFIALVEDSLSHDSALRRKARQDSVRNATWDARTREVGLLLASMLKGERPSARQPETGSPLVHAKRGCG
jgi:glycosyltransferase involved in cell wall biosynthesis